MQKTRVLVVDDSVIGRRLVSDVLAADPMCQVVGTAPSARIALRRIEALTPDVVAMVADMREADGLDTRAEIARRYVRLPVFTFPAIAAEGSATPGPACLAMASARLRTQLLPRVRAVVPGPSSRPAASSGRAPLSGEASQRGPQSLPALRARGGAPAERIEILAIGASTGGPDALAAVFSRLPPGLAVPVVVALHMPAPFTKLLAKRLTAISPLCALEAADGEVLTPGGAWIAPGDHHLIVRRQGGQLRLALHSGPPENSCRPSVDVLFRSVAAVFGPRALAVVLTGMGHDGLRGCEAVRGAGGQVVVQDEATSVVWGMPGAVARASLADAVLPLDRLAAEISRRVGTQRDPIQVERG